MSTSVSSPLSRRLTASCFWCGVSLNGRPNLCPRALARALPSLVRARINSRSNSASPAKTVTIKRPCAVVVSAHASLRERKPAPLAMIVASVFKRSQVKARYHQHVAFGKPVERAVQLDAVCLRAARRFLKDLLGSGGAAFLRVEAAVGRYITSFASEILKNRVQAAPYRNDCNTSN